MCCNQTLVCVQRLGTSTAGSFAALLMDSLCAGGSCGDNVSAVAAVVVDVGTYSAGSAAVVALVEPLPLVKSLALARMNTSHCNKQEDTGSLSGND